MTRSARWEPFRELSITQNGLNGFFQESCSPEAPEEAPVKAA